MHNLYIYVLNIYSVIVFNRDLFIHARCRQQRQQPLIVIIIIRLQTFRVFQLCGKSQKIFSLDIFSLVSWYIPYTYIYNIYTYCYIGSAHIPHYYIITHYNNTVTVPIVIILRLGRVNITIISENKRHLANIYIYGCYATTIILYTPVQQSRGVVFGHGSNGNESKAARDIRSVYTFMTEW